MDGDLHVALQDATGDKAGIVVCEVPAKPEWLGWMEGSTIATTAAMAVIPRAREDSC
jgi:hypothetical protein